MPLGAFEDDLAGIASVINAESALGPLAFPFVCEVGLRAGGDSAREERRLSREGDSRRLFDEARGDGFGRPSRLAELRPKGTKPLEGEGARPNPP